MYSVDSYGFWLLIGIIPILIGIFNRPGDLLYQDDLKKKSARYREINTTYSKAHLLFLFYILLLVSVWIVGLKEWSTLKFGVPFYPFITIGTSSYGVFLAIFAIRSGVYPAPQSQTYSYADKDSINRKAKQNIYFCAATMIFAVVIFLIVFQ